MYMAKKALQVNLLKNSPKKKKGRPPMYAEWLTEEALEQVKEYAQQGLINKEIANKMGVNTATLYEWQNRFPDFADAIKKGKKVIDEQVENSLLKRAIGYQYEEETWGKNHDGDMVVVKKVLKSQAPDVTAQIFWLKNRNPKEWRDKQEILNGHNGSLNVEMSDAMERWSQ